MTPAPRHALAGLRVPQLAGLPRIVEPQEPWPDEDLGDDGLDDELEALAVDWLGGRAG